MFRIFFCLTLSSLGCSFLLPRVEHVSPMSVGLDGGILEIFGERLFPTVTAILVGAKSCPLIKARSDPHGQFLSCHLPPSNVERVVEISVRSADHLVACHNCHLEYRYDLLAQADVSGSHLKGVPGDTLHLLPVNDWNLVEHHLQLEATIGGLSTTPNEYESVFRRHAGANEYSDQLHVSIPIGLEAGDYPLQLSIDRSELYHPTSHGHVRFVSNSTPTVRVVPAVTDISHKINSKGGVDVEIFGLGFSPKPVNNYVVLAGHECIISRCDYHFIYCSLSPRSIVDWKPSSHAVDRGFPLNLTPLKQDNCSSQVVIDEPSITIQRAITCMSHSEPIERVVLSSEFVFPVPHPLHVKGFRTEQFHAIGEAYIQAPISGRYTFLIHCKHLRFKHLGRITLQDTVNDKLYQAQEKEKNMDGSEYVLGPVLFLAGKPNRYLLKAEFLHLSHGEQFRMSVKIETLDGNKSLFFKGVPAEWFSFTHPLPREVHIEVNGFDAVCRPHRPRVGCQFAVTKIPKNMHAQIGMLKATEEILAERNARNARKARRRLTSAHRRRRLVELSDKKLWSAMKSQVDSSTQLTILKNAELTMDADMNVLSLIVKGKFIWNTKKSGLTLKAGYILVLQSGKFTIGSASSPMLLPATIYIKNNGQKHAVLGTRFFAGYIDPQNMTKTSDRPEIQIHGRPMSRTWSLMNVSAAAGDSTVTVEHLVAEMGWLVGHRILITPTYWGSKKGSSEEFTIKSIAGRTITLSGQLRYAHLGSPKTYMQAEVVNMERNIKIKGDEVVDHRGLHTVMHTGGVMQITFTHVQDCGQRGLLGHYCLHFHLLKECPKCLFRGNCVENSWQRGIVVHGTHKANIEMNIAWKVRGANFYIEDGNELNNTFLQNVAICHDDSTSRADCRIAGTDNQEADYIQQSGLWALSVTNNFIENHFVHTYNGLFTETSAFIYGKGMAKFKVCPKYGEFGKMVKNVNHGCGRFGFYLDKNWPRFLQHDNNGYVSGIIDGRQKRGEWYSCQEYKKDGTDNGFPGVIEDGLDFFNNLVGQYELGDMQWLRFKSINNNHGMYWKETKNFANGCSAHVKDSIFKTFHGYDMHYGVGLFLGPGGIGAFIFDNTTFAGEANCAMCANQHCQVGDGTGVLCTPEFVFKNCKFALIKNTKQVQFSATGDSYGVPAIFTSFDGSLGSGIKSIVHPDQTHLKTWSGGKCKSSDNKKLNNGIVCSVLARRLQIWSQPQTVVVTLNGVSTGTLKYLSGTKVKQGYGVPVLAGKEYNYQLTLTASKLLGVEFSDITFGNFFGNSYIDETKITLNGKACGNSGIVTSMHDRRWIGAHGVLKVGGGACGSRGNEPQTINGQCPAITRLSVVKPVTLKFLGWGACSTTCGAGVQTNPVICRDAKGQIVSTSICMDECGPVVTVRSCNLKPCKSTPGPTHSPTPAIGLKGFCKSTKLFDSYQNKIKFCANGKDFCRVYQAINSELTPRTCRAFCKKFNLECQDAWSDAQNDCRSSGEIGCDSADGGTSDHICQCGPIPDKKPTKNDCTLTKRCVVGVADAAAWLLDPKNRKQPENDKTCEWAYRISVRDNGLTGIHEKCRVVTTLDSYKELRFKQCYGEIYKGIVKILTPEKACTKFWNSPVCESTFVCGYGWTLINSKTPIKCSSAYCTRSECCAEVSGDKIPTDEVTAIAVFGTNTDTVKGSVIFRQLSSQKAPKIEFKLTGLNKKADQYHVHTGKVQPNKLVNGVVDCSYEIVGGHLNPDGVVAGSIENEKGDLSGKFGSLLGLPSLIKSFTDTKQYMNVQRIIGRSIVLHLRDGESWVCANIVNINATSPPTKQPSNGKFIVPTFLIGVTVMLSIISFL